jgi:hypothetical protein
MLPIEMFAQIAWRTKGISTLFKRQAFVAQTKEAYLWSLLFQYKEHGRL